MKKILLASFVSMLFVGNVSAQEAALAPAVVADAAPVVAAVVPEVAATAPAVVAEAIAPAPIDAAKKALIMKFIDVFGTRKALEQNFELMLEQMPSDKPQEVTQFRERVKVEEIIELLVPIYDRNFSAEDLQSFIDFYQSPNGQKLLTKIPVLMQESVEVSAEYIEGKFPELEENNEENIEADIPAEAPVN